MSDRARLTYEQAWMAISDIAKACRDFNELQFKYRQLAITLLLAAYAAIGYFMTSPDPAVKAAHEARAAQAAAAQMPPGLQRGIEPPPQSQSVSPEEPRASLAHVRRVSLLILGIGLLATLGTLLIWLIDAKVYHQLLSAIFYAGYAFEGELKRAARANWPPYIHHDMLAAIRHTGAVVWISIFYWLAAVAGLLPWYIYVHLNEDVTANWMTSTWYSNVVAATVIAIGAVLFCTVMLPIFVRWRLAKQRAPAPEAIAAAPPSAPALASVPALVSAARAARDNAYAPYSGFSVGASVLAMKDSVSRIFSGCNVENAATGSTMCAERNAIAAAVAAGFYDIREITVYTEGVILTTPCGACRQVMHELARNARIHLASGEGVERVMTLPELLPHPFGPESLKGS